MLKRNFVMDRRRKKKYELEKLSGMIKSKIEVDIKNYNSEVLGR